MRQVYAQLVAMGDSFSPAKAERLAGRCLGEDKNEPGEAASGGRPLNHGCLTISFDWEPDSPGFEPDHADLLPSGLGIFQSPEIIGYLRESGATDIQLHVTVAYQAQCNLEFSHTLLNELAKLNISLCITCYEDE